MHHNQKIDILRQKRQQKLKILTAILICMGAAVSCLLLPHLSDTNKSKDTTENSSQSASTESTSLSSMQESSESDTDNQNQFASQVSQNNKVSLQAAKKPLRIEVTISKQNVTIFDSKDQIVESFICSTGKDGNDTPVGTFTIKERGESFFSKTYQEGAYYWTQFDGDFLFHSVPFDETKTIEAVEAAKLGSKASHGCVRISIDNAKWIYDNIPKGTKVVIK